MTELLAILKGKDKPLAVIVNKRDLAVTAMTARSIFSFQEVSQFLRCGVIRLASHLFIELLHTDFAVNKACPTFNFRIESFIDLNTVHNRTYGKLRLWLLRCRL